MAAMTSSENTLQYGPRDLTFLNSGFHGILKQLKSVTTAHPLGWNMLAHL